VESRVLPGDRCPSPKLKNARFAHRAHGQTVPLISRVDMGFQMNDAGPRPRRARTENSTELFVTFGSGVPKLLMLSGAIVAMV